MIRMERTQTTCQMGKLGMPSKRQITYRPINWLTLPLLVGIQLALVLIGHSVGGVYGMIASGILFAGYAFVSRRIILSGYYRGMKCLHAKAFDAAILSFRECADFLAEHQWIDRFRVVTMLSASAISFREMCLCNLAFTLTRDQKIDEATRAYQEVLLEFPGSLLASTSLESIELIRNTKQLETEKV